LADVTYSILQLLDGGGDDSNYDIVFINGLMPQYMKLFLKERKYSIIPDFGYYVATLTTAVPVYLSKITLNLKP
jgi:hypothetical protein